MKELVIGNPIYDKELKVLGLITALPYGESNKFQYIWVDKKGYSTRENEKFSYSRYILFDVNDMIK